MENNKTVLDWIVFSIWGGPPYYGAYNGQKKQKIWESSFFSVYLVCITYVLNFIEI